MIHVIKYKWPDTLVRHDFYLGVSPETTQELVTGWRCSYRDGGTRRDLTERSEIVRLTAEQKYLGYTWLGIKDISRCYENKIWAIRHNEMFCVLIRESATNIANNVNHVHYIVLYCAELLYTILHYTIWYYTTLYYTILHYTILHYITLNYNISYYTTLHYTTIYYIMLYYIIVNYTTLHYTILYYITL